jgi:hypothetical protein
VAAVLLLLTVGTGVMLLAIPAHVRARVGAVHMPARVLLETCSPRDVWLDEAERDVDYARFHVALHHLALSQRDCPHSAQRDRLYALSYEGVGDDMAALAAASRWVDSSGGARDACALLDSIASAHGSFSDARCSAR